jgi:hypothetical protein
MDISQLKQSNAARAMWDERGRVGGRWTGVDQREQEESTAGHALTSRTCISVDLGSKATVALLARVTFCLPFCQLHTVGVESAMAACTGSEDCMVR